jgi:hypothetical protein
MEKKEADKKQNNEEIERGKGEGNMRIVSKWVKIGRNGRPS